MGSAAMCTMPRSPWSIPAGAWSRLRTGPSRTRRSGTSSESWDHDRAGALEAAAGPGALARAGIAAAAACTRIHDDAADAGPDPVARACRMVAGGVPRAPSGGCHGRVEPQRHQRTPAGLAGGDGLDAAARAGCFAGCAMGRAGEIRGCAMADRHAVGDQLAAGRFRRAGRVPGRGRRDDIPTELAVHGLAGAALQQLSADRPAAARKDHAGDRRGNLRVARVEIDVGAYRHRWWSRALKADAVKGGIQRALARP